MRLRRCSPAVLPQPAAAPAAADAKMDDAAAPANGEAAPMDATPAPAPKKKKVSGNWGRLCCAVLWRRAYLA